MKNSLPSSASPYKVLARKYRPLSFKDNFVGQETTVKILGAAIKDNKLPHAILLSGIRGIGKTTTARIIARTLNCTKRLIKNDLPEPCGLCGPCQAILGHTCLDIIEMDAASRTSVEDVRDLIESLPYKPTLCSYKVYIIDEVHMLSKSAFNALLKTLEEPPGHIKFIFATTELSKIPATILSRCMRFDLRPFTQSEIKQHIASIAKQERFSIDDGALTLLSEAARGSARDALSLLDQARHLNTAITAQDVRFMLGRADLTKVAALFSTLLQGQVEGAFDQLARLIQAGAAPLELAESLLMLLHTINKQRLFPSFMESEAFSEQEKAVLETFAQSLTTPLLQTMWQLVSRGYEEIKHSPLPEASLEMLFIRLLHVKDLCTQGNLLASDFRPSNLKNAPATVKEPSAQENPALAVIPTAAAPTPDTFEKLVALFRHKREALLASNLSQDIHLIEYAPGVLKFKPTDHAPRDLPNRLKPLLEAWTGLAWHIESDPLATQSAAPTLVDQREQQLEKLKQTAVESPLVKEVLAAFPGAKVVKAQAIGQN